MSNVVPLRKDRYGATADDWAWWELLLGPDDLLPVVSNPHAQISEASSLKGLGKTPSVYNGQRRVVGIAKWTQKRATAAEAARWARESDYGLCLQTRDVRALDLDDSEQAEAIAAVVERHLGPLPTRTRPNSGKRLMLLRLRGELSKRSFKTATGLVEFLAGGQQAVLAGTHTSGVRYEWLDGLPMAIPEPPQAAVEALWAELIRLFAVEPEREGGAGADRSRADLEGVQDDVVDYLYAQSLVLDAVGEKVFVECPWAGGHSGDSGISQTAWLVAGTKGFAQGHFDCRHASCSGRKDEEFLDAIGFRAAAFEDLDDGVGDRPGEAGGGAGGGVVGGPARPYPPLARNKAGQIEPTLQNLEKVLARPDMVGGVIRFDTFRDELMWDDRPFRDADAVRLRTTLEVRGFKPVGRELLRDALLAHAEDNQFDSAQEWLEALPPWDGVPRVETFCPRLLNVVDSPYTRAVGAYIWTALAGRVMDPGCKADMVPILQGAQGLRKSSAVEALAPDVSMFRELNLAHLDADLSRRLRGCVVGELAELRGLKTRDAESIRAWIVQKQESWRPLWREHNTFFSRRCVLFATTNPVNILDDETGERRWLPMAVLSQIDTDALRAVRDQLWAEGLLRWRMDGVAWKEAEELAKTEHAAFKVRDPWEHMIMRWLREDEDVAGITHLARGWVHLADVAQGAVGVMSGHLTREHDRRIAKCLKQLGWKGGTVRSGGETFYAWKYVGCDEL